MRIVGIQSGNAVDGIDVGIFDFEPLVRSAEDPRALAGSIQGNQADVRRKLRSLSRQSPPHRS